MATWTTSEQASAGEEPLELAIRGALGRYRLSHDLRALGEAFAAGRAATAATAGIPRAAAAERRRYSRLAAVEELIDAVTDAADGLIASELARIWTALGFPGASPRWTAQERRSARRMVALAVVAEESQALPGMVAALRRVAAPRLARLLVRELERRGEEPWRRLLGERYASVAHRCAPRPRLRSRQLPSLLAEDPALAEELGKRLAGWFRAGAAPAALAGVVEAVIVHFRTPIHRA